MRGLGISLCLCLVLLAGGCNETTNQKTAPAAFHENYEVRLPFSGTLAARHATIYSSSIPAKSMKVTWLIEEGVQVQQGRLLVRFDDSELKAAHLALQQQQDELVREREKAVEEHALAKISFEELLTESAFNIRASEKKLEQFIAFGGPSKLKQLEQEKHLLELKTRRLESETSDLEQLNQKGHVTHFELAVHKENLLAAKYQLEKTGFELKTWLTGGMHDHQAGLENELLLQQQKKLQLENRRDLAAKSFENHLRRLTQQEQLNQTALGATTAQLKQTELYADHDGLVLYHRSFRDGQEVKPSVGFEFRRAQPILRVQDSNRLYAASRINEFLLNRVTEGMPVTVVADARRDTSFEGRVSFIGLLAELKDDDAERAFDMRIDLQNPPPGLRPGMSVRCEVITQSYKDVWTLPRAGLSRDAASCLILRDGQETRISVDVLDYDHQTALVRAGLNPGDQVYLD